MGDVGTEAVVGAEVFVRAIVVEAGVVGTEVVSGA